MKRTMYVVLAFLSLSLSACANIAENLQAAANPQQGSDDSWMSMWTNSAKSSFQVRTSRIYPASYFVTSLKNACARGLLVEVIVPLSAMQSAQSLQGSCVHVYASGFPDMATTLDIALVDQRSLIVQGHLRGVDTPEVRREYMTQLRLKQTAEMRM